MTSISDVKSWIESGMSAVDVKVTGDGRHFEARIVSSEFTGKNTLDRQRLVYRALGDHMHSDIHAISLQTISPQED